jgi:hypothetical protein
MSATLARHHLEDIGLHRTRSLLLAAIVTRIAIGCSLILFIGCSGRSSTSGVAEILSLEEMPPSDSANVAAPKRPIGTNRYILPGAMWQVPPGLRATVAFTPGIMVTLFNSAQIVIDKLRLAKDGNETGFDLMEREVEFRLLRGSLIALVPSDGLMSHFRIRTDIGILAAGPGSLFYLEESEAGIHIACIRGDVALLGKNAASLVVSPGKWCDWKKGEAEPTQLQAAAASSQAQQEIAAALEAEAAMQTLLLAEQKSVPHWRHP